VLQSITCAWRGYLRTRGRGSNPAGRARQKKGMCDAAPFLFSEKYSGQFFLKKAIVPPTLALPPLVVARRRVCESRAACHTCAWCGTPPLSGGLEAGHIALIRSSVSAYWIRSGALIPRNVGSFGGSAVERHAACISVPSAAARKFVVPPPRSARRSLHARCLCDLRSARCSAVRAQFALSRPPDSGRVIVIAGVAADRDKPSGARARNPSTARGAPRPRYRD